MTIQLPKQWKHWCKDQGLRPCGRIYKRGIFNWYYLKGKGFYWRINCHAEFQRGDNYIDFDRWALCETDTSSIPQSLEEFRKCVADLISKYQN